MNLTLKFWNEMGYEYLGKTAQNLRDKIAHIDKSTKTTSSRIGNEISNQREQREDQSSSTPRTGGSVGWAQGCHAGGREFNSGRTNTQGL